jgi:circadian clock protein KaiB
MPARKPRKKPSPKANLVNDAATFEELLRKAKRKQHFVLRLYITGNTARSGQAISNIRSLCEEYLPGRYDLEVIDIYQQPTEAAKEQIIAAPTLIKKEPVPARRLIGDLSNRDKVLVGLNLVSDDADSSYSSETKWIAL